MKKLNYLILLIPFLLLSCSKDSNSSSTPPSYSVQGLWKTTSAVLNGVEKFGGANTVKSELNYFNADGSFSTQSYTDTNFSNLYMYSSGTYTLPTTSIINISSNVYSASGGFLTSSNVSCEVLLINSTQLQLKVLNYPAANDVYIKKFIR
ncbi:MAG: hypothetical protein ACOYLT_02870 [Flavobacterium sp.]|jgi:hypothetical protein|uniref:hypothetical protein n=1 Tax=Flavobacterium sp. TaxID=239 RepID=UPI003BBF4CA3